MTKSEVIKKTARIAGIPETESKRFFEMLLEKIYSCLNKNNVLVIDEIGEFRIAIFQRESESSEQIESEFILLNPVFIDDKHSIYNQKEERKTEPLLFQIPESSLIEENIIDKHFSLSIDKPVIPLGEFDSEELYYRPMTGQSFIETLENEAQKIINVKGKLFAIESEEEEMVLQSGDDWQVVSSKRNNPFKKEYQLEELEDSFADELIEESDENIPWNFGEIVYDENEISDKLIEDEISTEENNTLSWNFGTTTDEVETEDVNTDAIDSETIYDKDFDDLVPEQEVNLVIEEKTDQNPEDESDIFKLYHDSSKDIPSTEDVELLEPEIPEVYTEKVEETPEDIPQESSLDFSEEEVKEIKKYEYQTKKRATGVFWIALIVMMVIPAFIYYVWTNNSIKEFIFGTKQETIITEEVFTPTIIERDYSIPVAIPFEAAVPVQREETMDAPTETVQQPAPEIVQPVAPAQRQVVEQGELNRVKDLIFSKGNVFFVQVSSWQTMYNANRDSANYVRRGYQSHIISSYIQNLGRTQHRVVIGPFETLNKAEEFSRTLR